MRRHINFFTNKNFTSIIVILGISLFLLLNVSFAQQSNKKPTLTQPNNLDYVPEEVIVKFKPKLTDQYIQSILKNYKLKLLDKIERFSLYHLRIPDDKTVLQTVDLLTKDERIKYAQPNWIYRTNKTDSKLEELQNQSAYQTTHLKKAIEFMRSLDIDYSKVMVVVVDTGIKKNHEFFSPEDFYNPGEKFITDFVDIHLPLDDRVPGEDYKKPDNKPEDHVGHGTHVAGIVKTVTDGKIKIWPLRAGFYPGYLTEWGIVQSIIAAADKAAKEGKRLIFNFSFGRDEPNVFRYAIYEAIKYALDKRHSVFVAAAGNEYRDRLSYPAGLEEVVAVGATDKEDRTVPFSNRDTEAIFAPGYDILSSWLKDYKKARGTSMASPFIAGVTAYVLAIDPELNNEEVYSLVKESADLLNPYYADFRAKRVNAYRLVTSTFAYSTIKKIMAEINNFNKNENSDEELKKQIKSNLNQLIQKDMIKETAGEEILEELNTYLQKDVNKHELISKVLLKLYKHKINSSIPVAISTFLNLKDPENLIAQSLLKSNIKTAVELIAKTHFEYGWNFLETNIGEVSKILLELNPNITVNIVSKLILDRNKIDIVNQLITTIDTKNSKYANLIRLIKLVTNSNVPDSLTKNHLDVLKTTFNSFGSGTIAKIFDKGIPELEALLIKNMDPIEVANLLSNTEVVTLDLINSMDINLLSKALETMDSQKASSIIADLLQQAQFETEGLLSALAVHDKIQRREQAKETLFKLFTALPTNSIIPIMKGLECKTIVDLTKVLYNQGLSSEKIQEISDALFQEDKKISNIISVSYNLMNKDISLSKSDFDKIQDLSDSLDLDSFMHLIINTAMKEQENQEKIANIFYKIIGRKNNFYKTGALETLLSTDSVDVGNLLEMLSENGVITDILNSVNLAKAKEIVDIILLNTEVKYNVPFLGKVYKISKFQMAQVLSRVLPKVKNLEKTKEILIDMNIIDLLWTMRSVNKTEQDWIIKVVEDIGRENPLKADKIKKIFNILHKKDIDGVEQLSLLIKRLNLEPKDITKLITSNHPSSAAKIMNNIMNTDTIEDQYVAKILKNFFKFMLSAKRRMGKARRHFYNVDFIKSTVDILRKIDEEMMKDILYSTYSTLDIAKILGYGISQNIFSLGKVSRVLSEMDEKDLIDIFYRLDEEIMLVDYRPGIEKVNKISKILEGKGEEAKAALIRLTYLYETSNLDERIKNVRVIIKKEERLSLIGYILDKFPPSEFIGTIVNMEPEEAARILQKARNALKILKEIREKNKLLPILNHLGPAGYINVLNQWQEKEVAENVKWLISLNAPIVEEIVQKMIKIDKRWDKAYKFMRFLMRDRQEDIKKVKKLFKHIVKKFKPKTVGGLLLKDEKGFSIFRQDNNNKRIELVQNLLASLQNQPQLIARILWSNTKEWNKYNKKRRAIGLAKIILSFDPGTAAKVISYFPDDERVKISKVEKYIMGQAYKQDKVRWFNSTLNKLIELDDDDVIAMFKTVFKGEQRFGDIASIMSIGLYESEETVDVISIIEPNILADLLEENHSPSLKVRMGPLKRLAKWRTEYDWPEDAAYILAKIVEISTKEELSMDFLTRMNPAAVAKILTYSFSPRHWRERSWYRDTLVKCITKLSQEAKTFSQKVKDKLEKQNSQKSKIVSNLFNIYLFLTDNRVSNLSLVLKSVKYLYHNLGKYWEEKEFFERIAQIITIVISQNYVKSSALFLDSLSPKMRNPIFTKLVDLLAIDKLCNLFIKMQSSLLFNEISTVMKNPELKQNKLKKFLEIVDKFKRTKPELSNSIAKILYNETTLTIKGSLKNVDFSLEEPLKIKAYLMREGTIENIITTKGYETYATKELNYLLKIPILNEEKEVWREILNYGSDTKVIIKAQGYPHIRIVDGSLDKLLGGNITVNFGDPLSPEERKQRVIISGKIVNPSTGLPQENIDIKIYLKAFDKYNMMKMPVQIVKSDPEGNYRLEIPLTKTFRNTDEWNIYKITVEVEGYEPIEIEIPAEEAEEKLFGQVITVPPPKEPVQQTNLPPEENVAITSSQDSKNKKSSNSSSTFIPPQNNNDIPFPIW